jgi:histidinol-phosphate/aromatic aminotransferase/cobyric acid decarboxylase-like protein
VIADPDYGDITDPVNGRDIGIERQTPAEAGNQYGKTTVRVKPNQTPITEDKALLESVFENQANVTELYTEPSYDDLKEALATYLNPETDTDTTTTSNGVAATTAPTTNTGTTTTAKTENVEDAFDQLFNQ